MDQIWHEAVDEEEAASLEAKLSQTEIKDATSYRFDTYQSRDPPSSAGESRHSNSVTSDYFGGMGE